MSIDELYAATIEAGRLPDRHRSEQLVELAREARAAGLARGRRSRKRASGFISATGKPAEPPFDISLI